MSEIVKNHGEHSERIEEYDSLKTIEFNPDRAKEHHDQLVKRNSANTKPTDLEAMRLKVLESSKSKEAEENLSPEDAANEYLSLLDDISKDFNNPYYTGGYKTGTSKLQGIVTQLGKKYSDDPHYHLRGHETEAGDKTVFRLGAADEIIKAEITWQKQGEYAKNKTNELKAKKQELEKEYSQKGRLGRFFGKRKHKKEITGIDKHIDDIQKRSTRNVNDFMADMLDIAYSRTDPLEDGKKNEEKNIKLNRRFFGDDDSERAKKVQRAIELRKKYVDRWDVKDATIQGYDHLKYTK